MQAGWYREGRGGARDGGVAQLVSGDPSLSSISAWWLFPAEVSALFSLWPLIAPRGGGGGLGTARGGGREGRGRGSKVTRLP